MATDPLEVLLKQLDDAQAAAAALAGVQPLGTRAIELGIGLRWYLTAFDGPAFVWLDAERQVERDPERRHQIAVGALMVEHAESLVQDGELHMVGAVSRRLTGQLDAAGADAALTELDAATAALAIWRAAPARAIASVPALDVAIQLHDRARTAYEAFVTATDPLVERQDELPAELVQSLQELEQAAAAAAIDRSLAGVIAEAIEAIGAGADEMVGAELPLKD